MPYGGIEHSTNSRVSALLRDGSHNIQIRPYFGVGGTRHPQQLVCFTEENWVKQSLGGGGGSAEKQRAYSKNVCIMLVISVISGPYVGGLVGLEKPTS